MLINFNHLKTFYNALVHKMKSFRGNWDQNDPTADDYIKNRPFYSEGAKEIEIVSNFTVEDYENGNLPSCNFVAGNKYKVVWNGDVYDNIICYTDGECNILGGSDEYPFYIDDDGGNSIYIGDADNGFIVSIYETREVVHKLDKKYLPDTVPTLDEVQSMIDDAIGNAIGGSY